MEGLYSNKKVCKYAKETCIILSTANTVEAAAIHIA